MSNPMYTPVSHQSQPPHSMPLEIHGQPQHQLPAIGQPNYGHHPPSHAPPMMGLPPPQGYPDQYGQHQSQDLPTPTTPAQESKAAPTPEQAAATQKALQPHVGSEGGRTFKLDVVQQPKRARMCGFGDKDRRPITPPPCIRLIVTDAQTGKEVDCNEIEHTMYVLSVDLWSEDATKEVNLVRHTTTTPSISSTTPASFEQIENNGNTPAFTSILPSSSRDAGYGHPPHPAVFAQPPHVNPYTSQSPYGTVNQYMSPNGYAPPNQYYPSQGDFRPDLHGIPQLPSQGQGMSFGQPRMYPGAPNPLDISQRMPMPGTQPQGMFTRNLIGSLSASAFRLTDPNDKIGIWFILQDLSVRTEGNFRLRFSFVNVGSQAKPGSMNPNQGAQVEKASCPVLASCFSEVFTVYSAKKFPGVCESTPLSKCFATQGIKIPIRKEGAGNSKNAGDDDDFME